MDELIAVLMKNEIFAVMMQNKLLIWAALTSVCTAAAAIAALTPTPKDDAWLGKVRKVIDWLGWNVFNAKNEPKKPEPKK